MKTLALFFALLVPSISAAENFTLNGKEYINATLSKIDELTVKISHESGVARVSFFSLPEETRAALGYDREKAALLDITRKTEAIIARKRSVIIANSNLLRLRVTSVTDTGLIGTAQIHSRDGKYLGEKEVFLVTPTDPAGYIDDAVYQFAAYQSGTFQFTTVLGASRTVVQFTNSRLD